MAYVKFVSYGKDARDSPIFLDYLVLWRSVLWLGHRWPADEGQTCASSVSDKRDAHPCDIEQVPGIIRAARQYGVAQRIMDLFTFDVTQNPWRCGELFDAIITDPPCASRLERTSDTLGLTCVVDGVRAGAKRLGRKKERVGPPAPSTRK